MYEKGDIMSFNNHPLHTPSNLKGRGMYDLSSYHLLSFEEEKILTRIIKNYLTTKDKDEFDLYLKAREKLILSNMRLVISIARKYKTRFLELDDLIQEGVFGLMKAIDKFDVDKGFKLSTYATWWIVQAIARSITENDRVIRIPSHVYESLSKINQYKNTYFQQHGHNPTAKQIAKHTGLKLSLVTSIEDYMVDTLSLDHQYESDSSLLDTFSDERLTPDLYTLQQSTRDYVNQLLKSLKKNEQTILSMRYGLNGKSHTLQEIGNHLKLSRERVRQIELGALRKLKIFMKNS